MSKFAAQSIVPFFSAEANAGRVARKAQFVVLVEVDDGSWCELDADDQAHAGVLARNWVDQGNARGASCWRVFAGGDISGKPFMTYWHSYSEAEAA